MQDLHRTLSGVPSCTSESSHAGWVWVAVLSSANEFGRTLISICAPRDVCISTAGISIGTIYNCFCHVMIALLQFHNDVIHFDPMELEDQEEREQAKQWVESHSCMGWRGGFLCVDGLPFNLFQSLVGMVKGSSIVNHNI